MPKAPKDMTNDEIVAHLKFSDAWYSLGIVDDDIMRTTVANFRKSDDAFDEHWRYRAYVSFMKRSPQLAGEQCVALFELGAADPDYLMGQQIMLGAVRRPECPPKLRRRAFNHPRTAKHCQEFGSAPHGE